MGEVAIAAAVMVIAVLWDIEKPTIYPKRSNGHIHWFAIRYYGSITIHTVSRDLRFSWPYRWTTPRR